MRTTTTDIQTCPRYGWCTDHLTTQDGRVFCRGESVYVRAEGGRREAAVQLVHIDGEPVYVVIDGEPYGANDAEVFARTVLLAVASARS